MIIQKTSEMTDPEAELRTGLLRATHDGKSLPVSPMGAVERLVLSSWEKWATHRRFPYKLTLHVALVLLTFAQMQLYDAQNAAYMRASQRNWCVRAFASLEPVGEL